MVLEVMNKIVVVGLYLILVVTLLITLILSFFLLLPILVPEGNYTNVTMCATYNTDINLTTLCSTFKEHNITGDTSRPVYDSLSGDIDTLSGDIKMKIEEKEYVVSYEITNSSHYANKMNTTTIFLRPPSPLLAVERNAKDFQEQIDKRKYILNYTMNYLVTIIMDNFGIEPSKYEYGEMKYFT